MQILFTKSQSVLSKAIRDITKEPVSHVALQFGWFVVHSNLLGLHIETADTFKKHSEVVYNLAPAKDDESKDLIKLNNLLEQFEGSWYDFGGLIFLGIVLFLKARIKISLPKVNLWQSSSMFLCTEWVTEYLDGMPDSMITPYKLYLKLVSEGAQ